MVGIGPKFQVVCLAVGLGVHQLAHVGLVACMGFVHRRWDVSHGEEAHGPISKQCMLLFSHANPTSLYGFQACQAVTMTFLGKHLLDYV